MLVNMERAEKWALFYKGKIVPIEDETIKWIKQDPTKIWRWFDLELMLAWKNIFPLTGESGELGFLPLLNTAWESTPNPWWRFVTDRPAMLPLPPPSSTLLKTSSGEQLSEKLLTELEREVMIMEISERKMLKDKAVECVMLGNLNMVKMIQYAEARIQGTFLTKMSVGGEGYSSPLGNSVQREVGEQSRGDGGMEVKNH